MVYLTRRHILAAAAGTAIAGASRGAVSPAAPRQRSSRTASRRSATSPIRRISRTSATSIPNAPKGGTFSQIGPDRQYNQNFLTFNSLNSYILKGDAAQGMELTFATLLVRAGDEPDAMYGLAAEKVRRSADGLTYRFFIRPEAKFHDGSPLTAHDVAFSLNYSQTAGPSDHQPVLARL